MGPVLRRDICATMMDTVGTWCALCLMWYTTITHPDLDNSTPRGTDGE